MEDKKPRPWRQGQCDALFGRDHCNPYGWVKRRSMELYNEGYMTGVSQRINGLNKEHQEHVHRSNY